MKKEKNRRVQLHPKQVLYVELSGRADKYDILRRKEEADE